MWRAHSCPFQQARQSLMLAGVDSVRFALARAKSFASYFWLETLTAPTSHTEPIWIECERKVEREQSTVLRFPDSELCSVICVLSSHCANLFICLSFFAMAPATLGIIMPNHSIVLSMPRLQFRAQFIVFINQISESISTIGLLEIVHILIYIFFSIIHLCKL